ncbi:MAG TPA: FHA domain-containing protein [Vicinamibacterales bacterium]|nr:FHA domain-containing protein [Vicinamibacterales bacterium]
MWILQSASDADGDSWTFRMAPGTIKTIGRAPRADFVVEAALVSRLHCRLTATDSAIDVVDLDSTNGTYINNQRVRNGTLSTGDRLKIGRVEMTIDRQDLS